MTTLARRHVVVDTRRGPLSWIEEPGPRGLIRTRPRLGDRDLDRETFSRLYLEAVRGVSPSL